MKGLHHAIYISKRTFVNASFCQLVGWRLTCHLRVATARAEKQRME